MQTPIQQWKCGFPKDAFEINLLNGRPPASHSHIGSDHMPSVEPIIARIESTVSEYMGEKLKFKTIKIDADDSFKKIEATLPFMVNENLLEKLEEAIKEEVVAQTGKKPKVKLFFEIEQHKVQLGVSAIPGIANMIAIGSGKGGVGKSTTTANLAVTLRNMGAHVGILDADIYGPSQPTIFNQKKKDLTSRKGKIQPVVVDGIKMVSIGFMVHTDEAVVWRGAIVNKALEQLLFDTEWGDIDYLLVDLPPGTGDIQLTMAQKMPITGAVIVSTPQDLALIDARKAASMFTKVGIPVIGVLENMSMHVCSNCGHAEPIFGEGGAAKMAETLKAPLLGKLPLSLPIRLAMDEGNPVQMLRDEKAVAEIYDKAAMRISMELANFKKDYSHSFSGISIVKEDAGGKK